MVVQARTEGLGPIVDRYYEATDPTRVVPRFIRF